MVMNDEPIEIDYKAECYRLLHQHRRHEILSGIRRAERGEIAWRNLYIMLCKSLMTNG